MAKVTITITDLPAVREKKGVGSVTVDYAVDPPITKDTKNTAALHLARLMIEASEKVMKEQN